MFTAGDMSNSSVIIRDKSNGKTLAEATILKHDPARHVIMIDGKYYGFIEDPNVSMLIVDKKGVLECLGVVRKPDTHGVMEIAIYKGEEKENRKFTRYPTNLPAVIDHVVINGKERPLKQYLEATVINISSSGVLVKVASNIPDIGSTFHLKFQIAGNETVINTSVVRLVSTEGKYRELGCKFLSIL